jgi:putative heme-binding domain-containing protein
VSQRHGRFETMKLLLDTHAALWRWGDSPHLGAAARDRMAAPETEVFFSEVSGYEIFRKDRSGRLALPRALLLDLPGEARREGWKAPPLGLGECLRAASIESPHRDPFDRLIAAQSEQRELVIVTTDPFSQKQDFALSGDRPPPASAKIREDGVFCQSHVPRPRHGEHAPPLAWWTFASTAAINRVPPDETAPRIRRDRPTPFADIDSMRFPTLAIVSQTRSRAIVFPLAAMAAAFLGGAPPAAMAQGGLTEIPDTAVEAQLEAFSLIEGARIELYASEPAVKNPVHMNWDQHGRLWVVSSPLYPHIQPGQADSDSVVVLEDTTGDGFADKHTVFADGLHIPTAVLPGDGGCYVANAVEVLFLRDTNGDGVADERRVVLSGFGTEDTHHLVHTFRWGPEGKLWLNQSIYIHTHLETPYGVRRLLGGGMWHYRTETQRAEVFMKGLVNAWGHAFDEWGQSLMTDGAGGQGINFVFPRSVFLSSPGAPRILTGLNPGQPKHCGLEQLSGRHVPEALDGVFAAPDFRGNRINLFRLDGHRSAYLSTQLEDLLSSTHRAFRPIDIKMGPDGAIYVADWYNPIIQHGEVDFRDPRRDHEHGRIWRITFEGRDLVPAPQLAERDDASLAAALHEPEGWTRHLAMVEMRERGAERMLPALEAALAAEPAAGRADADADADGAAEALRRLRILWGKQALGHLDLDLLESLSASEIPQARAAALRALYYDADTIEGALAMAEAGVADPHPQVRLWAVSVLAQLDDPRTVEIALRALEGVEADDFLDFAVWSICREHAERWTPLTEGGGNPFGDTASLLFAARALNQPVALPQILGALAAGEIADDATVAQVADFVSKVGSAEDLDALFEFARREGATAARQATVLEALMETARLRRLQPSGDPARLAAMLESEAEAVFRAAATLAGQWKLEDARPMLEAAFLDAPSRPGRARAALDGLVALGGGESVRLFEATAGDEEAAFALRALAVAGRTRMNRDEGARLAVPLIAAAPEGADPGAIYEVFLGNQEGPAALAAAIEGNELPLRVALDGIQRASGAAVDASALVAALRKAGAVQPMKTQLTDAEMEAMMARVAAEGDPHEGERIYRRPLLQCIVCHAIGGAGGVIGPDMVSMGASAPVDYIIESLLEPSAKIKEGYHTTLVTLANGDSFAGAIAREDDNELVVRDAGGNEVRLAKADIAQTIISPISLMPPGLTASLREDEFVDLIAFLAELGKEGPFNTPPNRYLRHWEMLQPHARTRDDVGFYGTKILAEDDETYQWTPLYAKVAGGVPLEEMPQVVGRGNTRYGVARAFLETPGAGEIRLRVSGKLADLSLFLGEEPVELPDNGAEAEILVPVPEGGRHRLTAVGLKGHGLDEFRIEALDDAGAVRLLERRDLD